MKRKLQFLSVVAMTTFLGTQAVIAQTGGTYNSIVHLAGDGTTSTKINFVDFDNGANQNTTINPTGTAPFGYSDSSAGNTAGNGTTFLNNNYRPGTDVDIAAPATGLSAGVIALNSGGNEFLYYTVEFADSGKYHIDVNYGHSNANPRAIKFELLDVAFANIPVVLADGSLIRTNITGVGGSSVLYSNANGEIINPVTDRPATAASDINGNTIQFDVAAGTYVIKVTTINNGPNYVWFKFVRDGNATTLGVNDFGANNSINVYPNPSSTGVFNIGESAKWEAYSALGTKVASGEGSEVNLSAAAKGIYFIKTAKGTTKVSFQ
ncbi:T9SS type A sorting domain-containing protein [Flavobacterium faecale]|uniref:T9SS type A sorting domain-containing protein n=1 Tax=Flavobacterium faecale TaxID=1355330 RepID=UPI003AACD359